MADNTRPANDLQAESSRTNERDGMIAFLVGVLDRIRRPTMCAEAIGVADRALDYVKLWQAEQWAPGPKDDPADWPAQECAAMGQAWLRGLAYEAEAESEQSKADEQRAEVTSSVDVERAKIRAALKEWSAPQRTPNAEAEVYAPAWSAAEPAGLGWASPDQASHASMVNIALRLDDGTWAAAVSRGNPPTEVVLRAGRRVDVERVGGQNVYRVKTPEPPGGLRSSAGIDFANLKKASSEPGRAHEAFTYATGPVSPPRLGGEILRLALALAQAGEVSSVCELVYAYEILTGPRP